MGVAKAPLCNSAHWESYEDWTDNPNELRTDVFYRLQESEQHVLVESHSSAEPLRK